MRALAFAFALLPSVAFAQSAPQTGPQQLASFLASSLAASMAKNDALEAQVADLQKQLNAAKEPAK